MLDVWNLYRSSIATGPDFGKSPKQWLLNREINPSEYEGISRKSELEPAI